MIRKMRKSDISQILELKKKQKEMAEDLKPGGTNRYGHKTKEGRGVLFNHVVGPDD